MTGRKKVMILIKGLGAGGAEKLLTTSIPYLNRDCYEYEVAYLLPGKNDLVHEFEEAGIPVFCLGLDKSYDPRVMLRLVNILKQRKVDLIHIHLPYAGIVGRIAARLAGVKAIVYTEHNMVELYNPITRLMDRLTYHFDDATIAVSDSVLQSVMRSRFLKPSNAMTVLNGVDMGSLNSIDQSEIAGIRASLGIPPEDLVVGNVAHIRPEKGHQYLIQAAKKVLERCPNTTFVIIGREKTIEARQELESMAAELGIQGKVIFTGFREDAVKIMAACDLFVLSSLFEGLPVALLESMALGKPPVVTAVGGIPEVVSDGVDGYLVQPKDYQTQAERIVSLLSDGELRSRMSHYSVKTVKSRFSLQSMVQNVEQVYANALGS